MAEFQIRDPDQSAHRHKGARGCSAAAARPVPRRNASPGAISSERPPSPHSLPEPRPYADRSRHLEHHGPRVAPGPITPATEERCGGGLREVKPQTPLLHDHCSAMTGYVPVYSASACPGRVRQRLVALDPPMHILNYSTGIVLPGTWALL